MERNDFRILVPLDGSPEAESILGGLMPLARRRAVGLTLFQSVLRDTAGAPVVQYLDKARRVLETQGFQVETKMQWGSPAREILYLARSGRFDLLALSTHGRSGMKRALVGSVAEEVIRRSPIPALVHRPGMKAADWKRIVVALDGSPDSECILDQVIPLAQVAGARAYLLHVKGFLESETESRRYLHEVAGRLEAEGVRTIPAFRHGAAAPGVVRFADEIGAGLVAVATHGRRGVRRLLLGSVAEQVLRKGPCAVLLRRITGKSASVGVSASRG